MTIGTPTTEALRGHGELVLIADDDACLRSLVRQWLEGNGYRTVEARDGNEAITVFVATASSVKMAVLDVNMPEKDGLEVMAALRRVKPALPVLIMSGYLDKSPFADDTAMRFLKKPFGRLDLLPALYELLHPSVIGGGYGLST